MNDQFIGDDHAYEVHIYQQEITRIQKEINDEMLLNSRINHSQSSNTSQQPLLVNTSSLNGENLEDCISISRDIERQEQLRKINRRLSHPTPLEATMTHEEIYECSFEDDRFLTALEYQNSLSSRQITDLDVSQSLENVMKYFDEEVNVDSGLSRSDTPTKLPATGTVAAAVANLQTQMSKSMGSPPPPYQEVVSPKLSNSYPESVMCSKNIQELRKRYEHNLLKEQNSKPQQKAQKSKDQRISAPPLLPAPATKAQTSPKPLRKSKVRQMASMFNNKIVQLMRRNSTEKKAINKSQSQNGKPQKKGVPKVRSGLPIYRTGLPSPVPSPRFKRRPSQPVESHKLSDSESACLVAEDVFRQLSVKDKALLYNKFIEDMSKQHPQFSVHARVVEANVQQGLARTERAANPPKVKELAREMEAKLNVPKPKISEWALKRLAKLQNSPEYGAANSRISPTPPPAIAAALRSLQEKEDQAAEAGRDGEMEEEELEAEVHISTLTVVLKPGPEQNEKSPKQRDVPRLLPRKAREQRFLNDMRAIERTQKRNNESMRASVSFETYGPPKKIRRTRTEHLQPKAIFQNVHMERLFYNWIMEKHGVAFDITTVENSEDSLCGNGDEVNSSKSSIKSKSKVHVLLEKAIAKLENVEARVMRRDSNGEKKMEKAMKIINDTRAQQDANKSVIEVELCNSKTGTSSDEMKSQPSNRMQRKVKRQAPQPPTAASTSKNAEQAQEGQELSSAVSLIKQSDAEIVSGLSILPKVCSANSDEVKSQPSNQIQRKVKRQAPQPPTASSTSKNAEQSQEGQELSSAVSSVKPSDADSESGLSSLPKPPENELQKSHDHNPAALSEHQLRVQASLQRLNIPDWFRQYNQNTSRSPEGNTAGGGAYKPGNFTRKRTTESGRWAGLNSKTTSLSSLGSQRSDRSPLLLSPSAHSHHGGQVAQQHGIVGTSSAYGTAGGGAGAFSRWSTSHLNSSQTSPSVSQRGSFTRGGPINSSFISVASGQSSVIRSSYRQPYLGWRSQEKLSQRTPHERLASSLLAQQQRTSPTQRSAGVAANGENGKLQPVTPEIQSSIKEVTSAIVHYVNDQTQQQQQQQQRSRSTSPNSRKCWLESSFVGIRPLDSPQTPVIENTATAFSSATNTNNTTTNNSVSSSQYNNYNYNYNTNNSSTNTLTAITTPNSIGGIGITTAITTNPHVLRMNGLSIVGGAPERSLSTASLEDVLASLLGLPSSSASSGGVQGVNVGAGAGAGASVSAGASVGVGVNVSAGPSSTSDPYARSTTTGDSASQSLVTFNHMPQQQQPAQNPPTQSQIQQSQQQLLLQLQAEQQRLRRRSEGDAPQQQKQQHQQQQLYNQNAKTNTTASNANTNAGNYQDNSNTSTIGGIGIGGGGSSVIGTGNATQPTRRVSLGDSSESNNKTTSELQIKCRNTKCDRSATPADAKKYYKSCHNCTHLYCSRECRRAHWEKHRKACLHSRASNLCRQVLATCKDDVDSQRHLSLLARKGFLSQGRGVVRVLFRSAEAAESFIKHGFQCMGEASYVRWPDLMPAEMGLELYSELLKLSTEYKPDSKMLIYVAICVVSEAPGMGQAPVRWERQLVSRCAKLKLCKSILAELEQQQQALQQQQPPLTVVAVPEPTTEILILTFNPSLRSNAAQGEIILSNILDILSRRGVLLRKHYPEIYQRLQTYTDGQTEKFNPVTLHPRDSQTGKSFVCIIMPVHSSDNDVIKLPSASDGGNRVTTIDVGSPAALAQLDDDELLTRSSS